MQTVSSLRPWLLIGAVAAAAALAGVFTMPLMDADEARYAQASAQMLQSGDFLHIRFLDEARNAKPAGIYWLQAASVWLSGQLNTRAIWAWRLPSVLGVVLAALATFWGGRALVGRRGAFWGALLLAPGLLFAFEGAMAKTDAMLVAMTALAMAALAQLRHGGGRGPALLFWAALGGGVLIKGPATPAIAALALLVLWRWEKRAVWMRPLAWWPGPMLAALMVLPWLGLMQWGSHGAYLGDALGGDLLPKLFHAQESHKGFFGLHLLAMLVLLFPATPFLPAAVARLRRPPKEAANELADWHFLLAWAGPWWLLMELIPTKLFHYPLPVYPALALLAGLGVSRAVSGKGVAATGVMLAPIAALVLLVLAWLASARIDGGGSFVLLLPLWLWAMAGALATGWFLWRQRPQHAAVLAILSAFAMHVDVRTLALPAMLRPAPGPQLAALLAENRLLSRQNPDAPPLAFTGTTLPSLAFYTGSSSRYVSAEQGAMMLWGGQFLVVEHRRLQAVLAWCRVLQVRPVVMGSLSAYNYTKGRRDQLVILAAAQKAQGDAKSD